MFVSLMSGICVRNIYFIFLDKSSMLIKCSLYLLSSYYCSAHKSQRCGCD